MNSSIPKTLAERIESSGSWSDLIHLFYQNGDFDIRRRNVEVPCDLYQDPVLCGLYVALHQEERATYLRNVVGEIKQQVLDLPSGSLITEVGCGPGLILFGLASDPDLASRGYRFAGYDPSPEMIRIARQKARVFPEPELFSFKVTDSYSPEAVSLLSRSICLICRNVLSWFPDVTQEFSLWKKHLPSNAHIYLRDVRRDIPFKHFKRRVLECMEFRCAGNTLTFPPRCMVTAYLRALTPEETESSLSAAGLVYTGGQAKSGVNADNGETSAAEMVFIAEPK